MTAQSTSSLFHHGQGASPVAGSQGAVDMKVFAVSDTHGNLDGLDPSGHDVVVMAGDLAPLRGWNERALVDQVVWRSLVCGATARERKTADR